MRCGSRSTTTPRAARPSKHTRVDWRIVNPNDVMASRTGLFGKRAGRRPTSAAGSQPGRRGSPPRQGAPIRAARARGRYGKGAHGDGDTRRGEGRRHSDGAPETLKAMSIPAPGGPFGYLRIYAFDSDPDSFITELVRLIPQLPDRGLIIDLRGEPGGLHRGRGTGPAAVHAERDRAHPVLRPGHRVHAGDGECERVTQGRVAPWKASLDGAVRNGELYAQPIPITDPAEANDLGQHYGGPVVLVADATTYSAGDLFAAGFVDNRIGPFICVGSATGAGGANVWTYGGRSRAARRHGPRLAHASRRDRPVVLVPAGYARSGRTTASRSRTSASQGPRTR